MVFQSKPRFVTDEFPKIFIDNSELKQVDFMKYLGVTLDLQLIWKTHFETACSKLPPFASCHLELEAILVV